MPTDALLTSPSASPANHVAINQEWVTYMIGLLYTMRDQNYWQGSDADIALSIDNVDDLIQLLMIDNPTICEATLPIGAILPYFGTLPANMLECNFALKAKADYPLLYDAVDPALLVDADHFRTPPTPAWFTALTKLYTASSQSGANNPANLDDASLSTIWVAGAAPTQWVEIAFNYPVLISSYKINCGTNTSTTRPKTWAFQAYVDGVWTDLHTQNNVTLNGSQEYSYNVSAFYGRYRMNITASQGGSTSPALATFQLVYTTKEYKYGIVALED